LKNVLDFRLKVVYNRQNQEWGSENMKFQYKSMSLRDVPPGTICIGELDYDNQTLNPVKYIPQEKLGNYVTALKIDPKTASSEEIKLIGSMKVCPQMQEKQ
jgi:hypothetical protein